MTNRMLDKTQVLHVFSEMLKGMTDQELTALYLEDKSRIDLGPEDDEEMTVEELTYLLERVVLQELIHRGVDPHHSTTPTLQ